jgi:hypothetical protein
MPVFNQYNSNKGISVIPGSTVALFNAETLAAPAVSVVIAPADAGPVGRRAIQFSVDFASAPTASVSIWGSNQYPTTTPVAGVQIGTSITTQHAGMTDTSGFAFYWAQLDSYAAGGALTVSAHVS